MLNINDHCSKNSSHQYSNDIDRVASPVPMRDLTSQFIQDNPMYWTAHAKAAAMAEDWTSAVVFWQAAIDRKQDHRYYNNRAAALIHVQRFRDAENDARQSIKLSANEPNSAARLNLAKSLLAQGGTKLEDAKRVIDHVINQSSDAKHIKTARELEKRCNQSVQQSSNQSNDFSTSQPSCSVETVENVSNQSLFSFH